MTHDHEMLLHVAQRIDKVVDQAVFAVYQSFRCYLMGRIDICNLVIRWIAA